LHMTQLSVPMYNYVSFSMFKCVILLELFDNLYTGTVFNNLRKLPTHWLERWLMMVRYLYKYFIIEH
jgi:hypothetical protein